MRPTNTRFKCRIAQLLVVWGLVAWLGFPDVSWSFLGEGGFIAGDVEKPKPEFSRDADRITAKLIPRAKNSSVLINFEVKNGRLVEINSYEWEKAARPEVDWKNFKCSLFEIKADSVAPGADLELAVSSDFFISSTQFFVFNPHLASPWTKGAEEENISLPDRVNKLVLKVKDGGPLDADGAVNGQVTVIGGPRDSFWGYALGTLFIRFFGCFIVLGVLQIGMQLSGFIFRRIESKKQRAALQAVLPPVAEPAPVEEGPSTETMLAIATALKLHFSARQAALPVYLLGTETNAWSQQGRERMMNVRNFTYRSGKH